MPLITRIAKPEKFNSTTLAVLLYNLERTGADPLWEHLKGDLQRARVDQMQFFLDSLVATDVLAVD